MDDYTGSPCQDIYNNNPETGDKSGYYHITVTLWIYCNMTAIAGDGFLPTCTGVGGGWRRIANIDISTGDKCPSEWHMETRSGVSYDEIIRLSFVHLPTFPLMDKLPEGVW